MSAPLWAQRLVERVIIAEDLDDPPTLIWRRSKRNKQSSGRTYIVKRPGRIVITAGTLRRDQRLVLLHELAHHVTLELHTPTFWAKAWELYRRYQVPIRYALQREGTYRKGAAIAYQRSRV